MCFVVFGSCCINDDVYVLYLINFVVVDFREYNVFFDVYGEVVMVVKVFWV